MDGSPFKCEVDAWSEKYSKNLRSGETGPPQKDSWGKKKKILQTVLFNRILLNSSCVPDIFSGQKVNIFLLFFQSKNKYFLFLLAKLQWTSLYTRIYTAGMQLPRKESFSLGLKFNHSTLIDIITFCGTLFSPTRINVLVTKNMPVYSAWL